MQDLAPDHLHVVVPHFQVSQPNLANRRKHLGHQVEQRLAGGVPRPHLCRGFLEFFVGTPLDFIFQGIDSIEHRSGDALDAFVRLPHEPHAPNSPVVG